MEIKSEETLYEIKGGAISGAILNAVSKAISSIYDLGHALGSAIRRIKFDAICQIK